MRGLVTEPQLPCWSHGACGWRVLQPGSSLPIPLSGTAGHEVGLPFVFHQGLLQPRTVRFPATHGSGAQFPRSEWTSFTISASFAAFPARMPVTHPRDIAWLQDGRSKDTYLALSDDLCVGVYEVTEHDIHTDIVPGPSCIGCSPGERPGQSTHAWMPASRTMSMVVVDIHTK
jgi:hypothetical protein